MPLFKQEKQHIPSSLLKDRYGWPPFSVLNTISWDWQRRKDEWEKLFKDSTVGRDVKRYNATPTNIFSARGADAKVAESVSEFDPYLCELLTRWFTVPGKSALILDPFAGGCVRGVVAAVLGHHYFGIDISPEQVSANRIQYESIQKRYVDISGTAKWWQGDAFEVLEEMYEPCDFVLTCPPYYNLERYTDLEGDLSNMPTYEEFLHRYAEILRMAAYLLGDDCFFVIVVSEIRASASEIKDSYYRGFVADTTKILQNVPGLHYYNALVLENALGSLPVRAPKYFDQTRKIGRHHQNILVFYKGNLENIEKKFGKYTAEL